MPELSASSDIDSVLDSLQPFAERINRHKGQARCCCDRCAHLAAYAAALMFNAQADTIQLCLDQLGDRGLLDVTGQLILMATRENVQRKANAMQERAQRHWLEIATSAEEPHA